MSIDQSISNPVQPFSSGSTGERPPILRREMVLTTLSQTCQRARDYRDLLLEGGCLTASALQMDLYAGAEINGDVLTVSFGNPNGKNQLHDRCEAAPVPQRSVFQFAIDSGHPVVIPDIAKETRFQDTQLLERNIKSGVVCPVDYREHHYGAIGLFSASPRKYEKDDVFLLQTVGLYLGPAVAHLRSEKSLAEHAEFLSAAIDSLEAMVVLLTADGAIMQINRACLSIGGFALPEIRGRQIWSTFCQPEEADLVESAILELRSGAKQTKREAFVVSKLGVIRRVSWTFTRLQVKSPNSPAFLATGIDITDQIQSFSNMEGFGKDHKTRGMDLVAEVPPPHGTPRPAKAENYEGRRHDRRPYQCIQLVAPCLNGRLPTLADFHEVRCYDISPGGFSFLLSTRPVFEELVAGFGAADARLYLRAKIKHVTPIDFEGKKVLKVGCEYLGRVRVPNQ